MIKGMGADGKVAVSVAAREKHTAVLVVERGDTAIWELEVEDHGVQFTVTLKVRFTRTHHISHGYYEYTRYHYTRLLLFILFIMNKHQIMI